MRNSYQCQSCKATFRKYPSQSHKYCSKKCMYDGRRGNKHWSYKGAYPDLKYMRIRRGDGKVVGEHRLIMELHLGRKLSRQEHVHHINRDGFDNRIENLRVVDQGIHSSMHAPDRRKKGWSRKHACCIRCGSHTARYGAKGLCDRCFAWARRYHDQCEKYGLKYYPYMEVRQRWISRLRQASLQCPDPECSGSIVSGTPSER
jgi:hypothetical protein